jgi:hypothetical protein
LSDIGERAPALKRQRDDFESTVDRLNVTTEELKREREEHQKTKDKEEVYKKSAEDLAAENSRLVDQVIPCRNA